MSVAPGASAFATGSAVLPRQGFGLVWWETGEIKWWEIEGTVGLVG